jgi:hypothetical protein
MLIDILPFLELNGQFGKLTYRTEGTPVPEPVEGPLSKPHIYTVAYASGSESSVFLPWLFFCFCLFCFPWLLLISVKFRVNPWQMLLLPSVANASASVFSSLRGDIALQRNDLY